VKQAIPWAAVGFVFGVIAGFQYGKKAQSNISKAVATDFDSGVFRLEVDTVKAARAGLADPINNFIDGLF
jgi:hypothetical protein